jgi:thiamine-phosphate pyrophosphorylase
LLCELRVLCGERNLLKLPRLMAIVDADAAGAAGWPIVELASAFLSGGATLLQLRAKLASGRWLFDTASAIVTLAHAAHGRVIINDRADIARLAAADGVHVGQDDLAPALVRLVVGERTIVGVSTHTQEQVDAAVGQPASPVSYVAVGPVFHTRTKPSDYRAVGLAGVRQAAEATRAAGVPLVAIGGIALETAPDVIGAGADSVAVIGDLLAAGGPEARVRAYLERLRV